MLERSEPGPGTRRGTARLILLGAVALLASLVLPAASPPTRAQDGSSINLIAIDVETTGNSATAYPSTVDTCVEIASGASRVTDIVVGPNGVPPNLPLKLYQFDLLYDPSVVNVSAVDAAQLLNANSDSTVFTAAEPVPGTDGSHTIAALDTSANASESGPGVVARVTFKAVGTGTSELELRLGKEGAALFTSATEPIPIENVQSAIIAVGTSCPATLPQPSPVPAQPGQPNPTQGDGSTPAAGSTAVGNEDASPTPSGEDGAAGGDQTAVGDSQPSGEDSASGDGNGEGFPLWAIAPIATGALALGAVAFMAIRYRRRQGR